MEGVVRRKYLGCGLEIVSTLLDGDDRGKEADGMPVTIRGMRIVGHYLVFVLLVSSP